VSAELERPLAPGDSDRLAAMFDPHAAHLYDYCTSRLADGQEAADATQATLIMAYSLSGRLKDADRLRAWLFALARRECASEQPVRAALPNSAQDSADPVREAEPATVEMRLADFHAREHATRHAAVAKLAALPSGEREVLDLVHRHHVSSADLPAILGLPASRAQALLAAAVENFERSEPDGELKVTDVSAIPLATLPSSVWRRTAAVVLDPDLASYCDSVAGSAGKLGLDGFPPQETLSQTPPARKLVLASAVLGALLLTPATAGAVLFSYYGGSPQAISHAISRVFGPPPPAPQVSGGTRPPLPPTLFPKKKAKGVLPLVPGPGHTQPSPHPSGSKSNRPSPSPTRRVSPTTSPSPSSSSPEPSPSPTPTPTPTPTATLTP
jgi:DNA-directed RNA polymerase specialized sigma24 family protein